MPSNAAVPMLSVNALNKSYGARCVIDRLSFSIPAGERVTIFAPSGAGKSTLINILSGVDRPNEGAFTFLPDARRSTIFQEPRLFPYMTVQENIFFPLRVQQQPITPERLERYHDWLEVCNLARDAQHYPYQLSGGMKQKVAFIRGMITFPDVALMDEPFKSIDVASKQRMMAHLLNAHPNITLLLVTHNLDEIPLLTSTLFVFHENQLSRFITYSDVASLSVPEIATRIFG